MGSIVYRQYPIAESSKDIRLITLEPGFWDEPISCTIRVVSLDDSPRYETLSYAWGDAQVKEPIQLNGHVVEVTVNLFSALKHLRSQMEKRVLWVDALCIDQQDKDEKSWQVSMMGDIYTACSTGLLWIGGKSEDSDRWCEAEIFGACEDCHIASPRPSEHYGPSGEASSGPGSLCKWHGRRPRIQEAFTLLGILATGKHLYEIPGFLNLTSPSNVEQRNFVEPIQAIGALLRRAWWSRTWTIQEAVLPRKTMIVCGSIRLPWDSLIDAHHNLAIHRDNCCHSIYENIVSSLQFDTHGRPTSAILYRFHRDIFVLHDTRNKVSNQTLDFIQLSRRFSKREAGDERDKVYAFLGLFDTQRRSLSADYNLHTEDLYRKLSVHLLTSPWEENPLAVMYGGRNENDVETFPSWATRFNRRMNSFEQHMEGLRDTSRKTYNACDSRQASVQVLSSRTISLAGLKASEVAQVGPGIDYVRDCEAIRSHLSDCSVPIDFANRKNSTYPRGGSLKYAFLRAALGDRYHTKGFNTPREPSKQELDTLKEWIFNLRHTPVSTQKWLKDNIEYHVLGRNFFTTSDGLLGFGPATMLPGDEIWVLFGSKVPFILRPLCHNSRGSTPQGFVNRGAGVNVRDLNRHIVVGDCYVQGIMQGEAVSSGRETQVFLR